MAAGRVVAVTTPKGQIIRLEDLPFGVVADIAKRFETTWVQLVGAPLVGDGFAAIEVFKAALAHAGEVPPPDVEITSKLVFDSITMVEDDDPDFYDDGVPTGGEAATT